MIDLCCYKLLRLEDYLLQLNLTDTEANKVSQDREYECLN